MLYIKPNNTEINVLTETMKLNKSCDPLLLKCILSFFKNIFDFQYIARFVLCVVLKAITIFDH